MAKSPPKLVACVVCCLLAASDAKRQVPQSLRDKDVFCETCYATVSEMYRIVKSSESVSLEGRIDEALDGVCRLDLMNRYAYPADLLVTACQDLKVRFENDIGSGLMATFQPGKQPRLATTVKDICISRMRACKSKSSIPTVRKRSQKTDDEQVMNDGTVAAEKTPVSAQAAPAPSISAQATEASPSAGRETPAPSISSQANVASPSAGQETSAPSISAQATQSSPCAGRETPAPSEKINALKPEGSHKMATEERATPNPDTHRDEL